MNVLTAGHIWYQNHSLSLEVLTTFTSQPDPSTGVNSTRYWVKNSVTFTLPASHSVSCSLFRLLQSHLQIVCNYIVLTNTDPSTDTCFILLNIFAYWLPIVFIPAQTIAHLRCLTYYCPVYWCEHTYSFTYLQLTCCVYNQISLLQISVRPLYYFYKHWIVTGARFAAMSRQFFCGYFGP